MLKKEYYCLVAGLPDLFFNENKPGLNSVAFREELHNQLSEPDFELVKLLFLPYDNRNLVTLYFEKGTAFNELGNYSKKFLEDQLSPQNEIVSLPEYMLNFLEWMKDRESQEWNIEVENILNSLFYEYVLKSKNEFLNNWFMFELNCKNILTTFNCVRFNYEISNHLLKTQQNTLVYSLLINKRLKPELYEDELPFNEQVFRIAESDSGMIEKEKALDKVRWDYLDEQTFFHYFTIEKILSFIIKLDITERWLKLDAETGKTMLNRLINDLKTSYEFPEEFSLTK
ncbi:MAG: DUF2764 family protein [Bacteroidota bacterium]